MSNHPLRAWRKENGIKLSDLAKLAQTTAASLSRIERGTQNPTMALLVRIIQATDNRLKLQDFFYGLIKNDSP